MSDTKSSYYEIKYPEGHSKKVKTGTNYQSFKPIIYFDLSVERRDWRVDLWGFFGQSCSVNIFAPPPLHHPPSTENALDDISLCTSSQERGALRDITQELFIGFLKLGSGVYIQGHHTWEASCVLHKGNWLKEQVVIEIRLAVGLLNCETAGLYLPKEDVFLFAQSFHVE